MNFWGCLDEVRCWLVLRCAYIPGNVVGLVHGRALHYVNSCVVVACCAGLLCRSQPGVDPEVMHGGMEWGGKGKKGLWGGVKMEICVVW